MRRILRVDADSRIGYGHAVRTAALLSALPAGETLICGKVERFETLFPGARQIDAPTNPAECCEVMASQATDVLICDSPLLDDTFWQAITNWNIAPVVAIDDYGGMVDADLILNGTVLPEYHFYPALRPGGRTCCGGAYALLRPYFRQHAWTEPNEACITVVAGSGLRAARWVSSLLDGGCLNGWTARVQLVVGWGFYDVALLERARRANIAVSQGLDGRKLAELLAESTLLLATGGMIVYEALAAGVPSIIFPQEDNMIAEAAWFGQHGGIVNLGVDGGWSSVEVRSALALVFNNPERRLQLSASGRLLVDGKGVQRAATEIELLSGKATQ